MLRLVPPAGTKLTLRQAVHMCARTLVPRAQKDTEASLIGGRIGVRHVISTGSGRAALYAILKALHSLRPERNVVAIPAYTCFSVPAAIVRAGLRIQPVDIDPRTLDFDFKSLEMIDGDRSLAIIGTELFGFVGDTERLKAIAASKSAFLIDDAAQAFGSSGNGVHAGSFGDVGFYSIGRGKPLFGMSGGLIVTNCEDVNKETSAIIHRFDKPGLVHALGEALRLAGYHALFQPLLYRIADSLPFLNLGATVFDPAFPLQQLSGGVDSVLTEIIAVADESAKLRRKVVAEIRSCLGATSRFCFPEPAVSCQAAYPRLPVIAEDKALRDRAVAALRKKGIGASPFYPTAICDIPGVAMHMDAEAFHCSNAEDLAATLFTLPTHSLLASKDIALIAEVLKALDN